MKQRTIQIHVHTLTQFISLDRSNFLDFSRFNAYRKQCIDQQRNQYIATFFHQEIATLDFAKTEYGKPYLINFPKYSFNHSHSQKNYALALSQQIQDLGIDIEDLDRKVRFEALAKHAFHPNEYETWESLNFDPVHWFKVWTTKEAVLKASGLGIRLSLNELDTQVHALSDGGMCQHPDIGTFAYQNYQLAHSMLTIAWRAEQSCKGFAFPQIKVIQH
ncbi:4'-phosphopantetheinyl transferase family protein [Acinetobacter sp. ANC 4648]|uniref:4'-phosphopantetheinyl transferase family protein n=1 Tax=Acinetobacter sp. ANC 4648 TaxID=1977875 RepID=UPI000A335F65|nr:4'-phosphopantetheinyl transferase superfamily protein [Acinetobacter sp. ANC 4648]OTG84732.1 ACP synthase [Acinetobacter sp. ANC 4648]